MNLKKADLSALLLHALSMEDDPVMGVLQDIAAEASAFAAVDTTTLEQDLSSIFHSFERRAEVAAELHRRKVEELIAAAAAPESREEKKA